MPEQDSTAPEPLVWTPELQARFRPRFLSNMPLIGPEARARRYFARKLKQRKPSALRLWRNVPRGVEFLPFITFVLHSYLRWPWGYFIPADSCAVLFMDPSTEMLAETAMLVMSDHLEFAEDVFSRLHEITLGELVMAIK